MEPARIMNTYLRTALVCATLLVCRVAAADALSPLGGPALTFSTGYMVQLVGVQAGKDLDRANCSNWGGNALSGSSETICELDNGLRVYFYGRPSEDGADLQVEVRNTGSESVEGVHPRLCVAASSGMVVHIASSRGTLTRVSTSSECTPSAMGEAVTLAPRESKTWKGRIYLGADELEARLERDFGRRGRLTPEMTQFAKQMRKPRVSLNPSNQYANRIVGDDGQELYNEGRNMWNVAVKAAEYLRKDGRVEPIITRETQSQVTSLRYEAALTNALECDLLVSLHSDATGNNTPGGGTWTFYTGAEHLSPEQIEALPYPLEDSKRLADLVQGNVIAAIRTTYPEVENRGVREHWYRLYMIHQPRCPSVLIEVLFHTNPFERELLKQPEFHDRIGRAVADAVLEFVFGPEAG